LAVTGGGSVGECGRLSQPNWLLGKGMVREWVAGKTVWSPCYRGPYLNALSMGSSNHRALCKCAITRITQKRQHFSRCSSSRLKLASDTVALCLH